LNVLSGLDNVTSGSIKFNGEELTGLSEDKLTLYRRENTGFIFQSYNLISTLTVRENVELGAYLSSNALDIDDVLKEVGLEEHKDKFPHQLSGGQQQRVAIARVLVKNPKVIFCDEPTGALDEKSGKVVLELLQNLNKKYNTTLVMVTHNPNIADMSHNVFFFKDGKIVENKINKKIKLAKDIEWS
ncbi:MAG: ABC transporter ATP-binding protein, partial [Mycoplasmatales bacterium]